MGTISRQTEGLQLFSVIKGGGKNKPTVLVKVSRIFLYFKCRHQLYGILFFFINGGTSSGSALLLECSPGKTSARRRSFLGFAFFVFLVFLFLYFCILLLHLSCICCVFVFVIFVAVLCLQFFCNQSFNHCIAHPLLNTHTALFFRCKWCDSGCWRYLLNIWCLILLMPTCQCWQCW